MAYRYCPQCNEWSATNEYTVDETGETVCPDHKAVHGYIGGAVHREYTLRDFRRDNRQTMYQDWDEMLEAARRQGIVVN